ncbi:MAG: CoA-transferase [Syntrophomonadaceae bacterium]|nr:CoA-transferase [Syntrophomonadaceae bacterium]
MAGNDYAKIGEFKPIDLLAVSAARQVTDGEVVFAGTGLPMLAIMLAQNTNAPNAVCIYEAGSVDGRPIDLPTSVGDARCHYQASIASGLWDVFGQLGRGNVDMAFLGGAEIDQYGSVNTTAMGGYYPMGKRLTGSGGNADINALAKRTVFIMVQEKRRWVERCSYITSPGWRIPKWPSGDFVHKREVYNKAFRGGPYAVISNMGVFKFDDDGIIYLETVHPGFTPEQVQDNCMFKLNISRVTGETLPPTYNDLELLYKKVDPEGIFLP